MVSLDGLTYRKTVALGIQWERWTVTEDDVVLGYAVRMEPGGDWTAFSREGDWLGTVRSRREIGRCLRQHREERQD